jgi:hypothetical protein
MAGTDKKYSVTEASSSKNPHDWGRAMATAISRLVEQADQAGDVVEHENLYNEDLHLFVEETADGVDITMAWTPRTAARVPDTLQGTAPDQ